MKLELYEHISRLLHDHECVVVPGFGAFLTRYHSAEVNHATHMMRPPSRRVYFNSSIRENDGLLAKSLSYTEQVTYSAALQLIEKHLAEWKVTLHSGKKLNLTGIGRLYLNDSNQLQFNPSLEINYLASSYGLSIFRSPAVQREAEIRKTINKAIEKHVITEHPETKKKKMAGWVSWAAVLGPVILASAIGYAYFTTAPQPFENISGFNWFNYSRSIEPAEADSPAKEKIATSEDTEASPLETREETAKSAAESEASKNLDAAPSPVPVVGKYHIVVGSFKDAKNAEVYISDLKAKGYDAYVAPGATNFSRVAIGSFSAEDDARNALSGIKQAVNPNSWLYAN